jgi:Domain of unknown function (DUF4190)
MTGPQDDQPRWGQQPPNQPPNQPGWGDQPPTSSPWGQPAPPAPSQWGQPPSSQPYGQPTSQPYGPPSSQPYGQPYGPPPGQPYGYGYPQASGGTNGMAIASLVCAFLCSILGLVFGIVALNQINQRPQGGRGLAIAGIVISIVSIGIGIAVVSSR